MHPSQLTFGATGSEGTQVGILKKINQFSLSFESIFTDLVDWGRARMIIESVQPVIVTVSVVIANPIFISELFFLVPYRNTFCLLLLSLLKKFKTGLLQSLNENPWK